MIKKNITSAFVEKYSTIIIFLVPALTLFTVFVVMPIFEAAYFSFYRWNGMGAPEKYVGFKNYAFLFKNGIFLNALKNNFWIIFVSLFIQLPFALFLALFLANNFRDIRSALVIDEYMAEHAIRHNCANFFSVPSKYVSEATFDKMVKIWKKTTFDGGRHMTRMKKTMEAK